MVSRERCFENDGRNGFWDLEAIETSDCHWKLEGEIGSFSAQGSFEIIEANLGFSDVGGAVLLVFKHLLLKRMVRVMPKLSIARFVRFGLC